MEHSNLAPDLMLNLQSQADPATDSAAGDLAALLDDWVAMHQKVLDLVHDGVLLIDGEGRFLAANQAAQDVLGCELGSLKGRRAVDMGWRRYREDGSLLPTDEWLVARALRSPEPIARTIVGVDTDDGKRRWLLGSASRVSAPAPGTGWVLVISFANITEQVRAMQAQQRSEQHFRLFTEASGDVIWISQPEAQRTLFVSKAFERLWGRPVSELLASHSVWLDAVHPEDRPRVVDAYYGAGARSGFSAEYRVIRPDGSQIWVRDRGYPVYDPDGRVTHLAGLAEDITAAHEIEQQVRRRLDTEQQLSRLVATAPGVLMTYRRHANGDIQVHIANPAVGRSYGLSDSEGKIKDIRDVILPEDRQRLREALQVSGQTMNALREEFRVQHPRYGLLWVEMHVTPVREADGAIAWHGFMHEVTARKQVEQEVLRINAELEARVAERTAELEARHREMEAFSYSVSHDLKAPLRGIDGYSRLLLTDHASKLDEEGRFFVETIRKATVHMGQLIDDLLAYSRVERSRPTLAPIDPSELIRQLVAEYRRELEEGGVQLTLVLDCHQAQGEREGLRIALRNLLDNALKFTRGREPRCVSMRCEAVDGACRIEVSDNGPGFDMRYHDRIFEIFQRLHRAEDYPGTGVGLAIVRKAVERMQGRVWAESGLGLGARFFVQLPH
ncbi:PAS domain S-box protein [Ideonella sp.]|uniref:PAS domain S-box protein n=1 Tax=Ideonella sp. TaxID=1929293 RepID=UPI003BB526DD